MYPVPACFKIIQDKGRDVDYYSVLYQALAKKYPENEIEKEQVRQTIQNYGVLSENKKQNRIKSLDCFQIVSEYKCNYICRLCPYHPAYRNQWEEEEKTILSYLLQTGKVQAEPIKFSALFLLMDEKPIYIPLHEMIYKYFMHNVSLDNKKQPEQFVKEFKEKNQGKISNELNYKKIKDYIQSLYEVPCEEADAGKAMKALGLDKDMIKQFLDAGSGELKVERKNLNVPPNPAEKLDLVNPGKVSNHTVITEETIQKPKENFIEILPPSTFDFSQECIMEVTAENEEQLEQELKLHPLFAMELLTDSQSGEERALLYVGDTFYSVSSGSSQLKVWLIRYLSVSSLRTVITCHACPIYYFFIRNQINTAGVAPIQNIYEVYAKHPPKNIEEVFRQLLAKTNPGLPFYLFAMPLYEAAWEILLRNMGKQMDGWKKIKEQMNWLRMLGYGWKTENYSTESGCLFHCSKEGYQFRNLTAKSILDNYCYAVCTVQSKAMHEEGKEEEWILRFLLYIAKEKIYENRFYLLKYQKNQVWFAIRQECYTWVCDTINIMATYLAEQFCFLPITVIWSGKEY